MKIEESKKGQTELNFRVTKHVHESYADIVFYQDELLAPIKCDDYDEPDFSKMNDDSTTAKAKKQDLVRKGVNIDKRGV